MISITIAVVPVRSILEGRFYVVFNGVNGAVSWWGGYLQVLVYMFIGSVNGSVKYYRVSKKCNNASNIQVIVARLKSLILRKGDICWRQALVKTMKLIALSGFFSFIVFIRACQEISLFLKIKHKYHTKSVHILETVHAITILILSPQLANK